MNIHVRLPRAKVHGEQNVFVFMCCFVNRSCMKPLLSDIMEKFLLWMQALAAVHIGNTSIRKATKWFSWWLVKPSSKNTVCVFSKLSWTCTFPLALKHEGYKIPYKCMKCLEGLFSPWKESFHGCKAECRHEYTPPSLLARPGGHSVAR